MLNLVQLNRCYHPETISVMAAAFDRVCQSVTEQLNGNDDVKKMLALIILGHVDRGERDPERLAETAFREWTGTDRSAIGDHWGSNGFVSTGFMSAAASLVSPPDAVREPNAMPIGPKSILAQIHL